MTVTAVSGVAAGRLVDDVLLARITTALAERGVAHGPLVEGTPHLNANVSDAERVFVKVSRGGEWSGRAATEVAAAGWATRHGITCAAPLLDAPLVLDDADGTARDVTVLGWVETCSPPALIDRAASAVEMTASIAAVPPPPGSGGFNLDAYLGRIRARLAGRHDTVASALLAAAESAYARTVDVLPTRPQRWIHADLHLLNLGWAVNGSTVAFDFESSAVGAVEVDLAQTLRSIEVHHPGHAPAERLRIARATVALAETRFATDGGIDWDLVAALCRFRAASSASHLIVHGHNPVALRADLTYLETPIGWLG